MAEEVTSGVEARRAPVIATYVVGLVVVWLVMAVAGVEPADPRWALEGRTHGVPDVWRVVGHAFIHLGVVHLVSNVLALWLAGRPLERMIGSRAMVGLLALGVLAGAIATILVDPPDVTVVGASGAGFALAGAGAVALVRGWSKLRRSTRLRLMSPFLLAASALALSLLGEVAMSFPILGYEVWFWFTTGMEHPVVHIVHAAALVTGVGTGIWMLAPEPWLGRARRPRALAATAGLFAAMAIVLALVRRADEPVTDADIARCDAGDRAVCERIIERGRSQCAQGGALGCHNAGVFLERGVTGPPDLAAPASFYQRACDGGFTASCLNLSVMLYQETIPDDDERARTLSKMACEGGFAQGCNIHGVYLVQGRGGAPDPAGARGAFRAACEARFALACRNLGLLLWEAGGSEREQALKLFEQACASREDPQACTVLERARAELVPPR